jgi:HPr kinase/phosphorylase
MSSPKVTGDGAAHPDTLQLHASAVACDGRGLLILGPSGSGKSALALQLMALGADLVSDDAVVLNRGRDGALVATAPDTIRGLVEARGIGLLYAPALSGCPIHAVVDLSRTETERLPPERTTCLLGVTLPLLHKVETNHFAAALRVYLAGGRGA